jgi:hypothetical protein
MKSVCHFCMSLITTGICWNFFVKFPHTKCHENPMSGSRCFLCGWVDGRTDMAKQ